MIFPIFSNTVTHQMVFQMTFFDKNLKKQYRMKMVDWLKQKYVYLTFPHKWQDAELWWFFLCSSIALTDSHSVSHLSHWTSRLIPCIVYKWRALLKAPFDIVPHISQATGGFFPFLPIFFLNIFFPLISISSCNTWREFLLNLCKKRENTFRSYPFKKLVILVQVYRFSFYLAFIVLL